MKIKNIIFDMGDVLVKIKPAQTLDEFCVLGAKREVVNAVFEEKEIFIKYHSGLITSETFRTELSQKLGLPARVTDEQFDNAWLASVTEPAVPTEDFKDRIRFIENLKSQGYKIFLLSNINMIHYLNAEKCYGELLDRCIPARRRYYSHHMGKMKPHPEAFQHVLNENNLNPNETIFLDDLLENVESAKKIGLHAMQFTRNDPMSNITVAIACIDNQEKSSVDMKDVPNTSEKQIGVLKSSATAVEMIGSGTKLCSGPVRLGFFSSLGKVPVRRDDECPNRVCRP